MPSFPATERSRQGSSISPTNSCAKGPRQSEEIGVRHRRAESPFPRFFFAFSQQHLNSKQTMPSGPHMGRHFIMTLMTVVWEGRQSFRFLHCGILGPLPPPTPAPTPCKRELFPKFSTLALHMLLRCFLARVSLAPLRIMGDSLN